MSERVDGVYDCVTRTPMGNQTGVFTVVSSGESFHGTISNPLGSVDVKDGTVDGNRLKWRMDMNLPLPMKLTCEAVVDGDRISASIDTGSFGVLTMTGTRRS